MSTAPPSLQQLQHMVHEGCGTTDCHQEDVNLTKLSLLIFMSCISLPNMTVMIESEVTKGEETERETETETETDMGRDERDQEYGRYSRSYSIDGGDGDTGIDLSFTYSVECDNISTEPEDISEGKIIPTPHSWTTHPELSPFCCSEHASTPDEDDSNIVLVRNISGNKVHPILLLDTPLLEQ